MATVRSATPGKSATAPRHRKGGAGADAAAPGSGPTGEGTHAPASRAAKRAEQSRIIHEINEKLSGPVLEVYRKLLPNLENVTYQDILASPELVNGCLLIFEKQRNHFEHLLVNDAGMPVADEDEPLYCGRSIDEIRVLVIRTTAKKYFRTHGDRFRDLSEHKRTPNSSVNVSLLERLFDLVAKVWQGKPHRPPPRPKKRKSGADVFYDGIAPYLRHRWQVPLIPYYAALPRSLIEEMGEGLLSMRRPEELEFLLRIGRKDFNEAQRITGELSREMLDTDPRAAKGVTYAGEKEYERLLTHLHDRMGARFWKVFTGTELLDSLQSKSTADIVEMASHLDRMSSETVESIIAHLQRPQIAPFLRVADATMDHGDFDAIFGQPGNPRLARIFAQKASQLRLDPDDPDDFENRLPFIFQAWRTSPDDFAKNL